MLYNGLCLGQDATKNLLKEILCFADFLYVSQGWNLMHREVSQLVTCREMQTLTPFIHVVNGIMFV